MTSIMVTFKTPEDIIEFLNIVEKYDFEMDMKRGRLVVDAKSLIGLMNLGLKTVVELRVYSEHCEQLVNEISRYVAA